MARYIDADNLLEELQEEIEFESSMYTEEQNKWFNIGLKCAVRDVKHQPTADVVEVKYGEWTLHPDGSGTCNQCGRTQKAVWDFDNAQQYCGKCGAKMDGGK